MTNSAADDDQDEKPLDAAMENVRRKMVRLQIVSVAIMVVSLMAVFGAVVYKTTRPSQKAGASVAGVPSDAPVVAKAVLPAGFSVQSVALSGSQILFYGTTSIGQQQALVFDYSVGRIVATVSLSGN
ncbi:hypothetical protein [Rhizobium tubonense]|uniref:Fimbrial protein n=1 Tax=Rhizobium tubonense TaxID=484088 RepID=A0A2W4EJE1_9HYPH|nr:hypothetical protein [Rhizobium tubonense]PZM14046.1 hypothetical protein CPY51_14485 [Rhizobium tubonense]